MRILVRIKPGGEGYREDINYLKYHLDGRPGGEYKDCNLTPVRINNIEVLKKDPLIAIVDINECRVKDYLGNVDDITYDILD